MHGERLELVVLPVLCCSHVTYLSITVLHISVLYCTPQQTILQAPAQAVALQVFILEEPEIHYSTRTRSRSHRRETRLRLSRRRYHSSNMLAHHTHTRAKKEAQLLRYDRQISCMISCDLSRLARTAAAHRSPQCVDCVSRPRRRSSCRVAPHHQTITCARFMSAKGGLTNKQVSPFSYSRTSTLEGSAGQTSV
jgi:hypothetical protein